MKDSFKNKLKQHRPEWDKEAFWAELEPELPKKPRRRFAWWMWMLPAALIIFSSAAWYSYAQNLRHDYQPYIPLASFAIPLAGDIPPPSTMTSEPKPPTATEVPANSVTAPIAANGTKDGQKAYRETEIPTVEPVALQSASKAPVIEPALSAGPALRPTQVPEEEIQSKNMAPTGQLPQLPLPVLTGEERELPLAASTEKLPIKAKGQWYQMYALGIAQPTRHFRKATAEIRDKKKQEEVLREVITAEYRIGYRHRSGWYAQAGLELQQRRELLQWQGLIDSSLVDQNIDRAFFIYDQNGQPAYQEGELEVTQLTRRIITQQNYYRMINLPVQLGYEYRQGRWSGFAQTGLHFNLLHTFSGKFINADNQVQDQRTVNQSLLRRNLGLGWSVGMGAAYRLLPEVDIFLQADYQQFRRSIHRGQGYEQWYGNWGLRVGMRRGL